MPPSRILECSFLIPVRRDANLSDGEEHDPTDWDWLNDELFERFGGMTCSPGRYQGVYTDPDTKARVRDESKKYIVAIEESRIDDLRQVLSAACIFFQQKCIYLNIAGRVEFVNPPEP